MAGRLTYAKMVATLVTARLSLDGMPIKEIARQAKCSVSTVRRRIKVANLRKQRRSHGQDQDGDNVAGPGAS